MSAAQIRDWLSLPIDRPALMLETLRLAVPLERARYAGLSEGERDALAARIDTHELHADDAMFSGRRAAEGMANIIRALALLSFAPGGVTFHGLHWCPDHDECIRAGWAA